MRDPTAMNELARVVGEAVMQKLTASGMRF
jgi:hypothetical protein